MFALLISMPRFKSIIFYQNSPKIELFLKKNAKFSSVGGLRFQTVMPLAAVGFAPKPLASGGWGLASGHQWISAPPPPDSQN